MVKLEKGVMIVKNGKAWGIKAWGIERETGHSISYGFINLEDARIYNPEFCRRTTAVTYKGSPYIEELKTAKLVKVVKRTEITMV